MTIVIEAKHTPDIVKQVLAEKLKKQDKQQGNLSKHFGQLKRNLDGLQYQAVMRKNED